MTTYVLTPAASTLNRHPAQRFQKDTIGPVLEMRLRPGELTPLHWLGFDLYSESQNLIVWKIMLFEQGQALPFELQFSALPHAQARVRLPLAACGQRAWQLGREGALLKPCCYHAAVDPTRLCRLVLEVMRKDDLPAVWRMTEPLFTSTAPAPIQEAWLPKGPLLDRMGQSRLRGWPTKTPDLEALCQRLQTQQLDRGTFPESFSRFGGWKDGPRLEATGFFRVTRHENRWWLVDPEGFLFWSTGLDCVEPNVVSAYAGLTAAMEELPDAETHSEFQGAGAAKRGMLSHTAWNFYRVFGPEWRREWRNITANQLRDWGFNTVANWSDSLLAREHQIPYIVTLKPDFRNCPMIFRDFPDVFHPAFAEAAEALAAPLAERCGDPLVVGYFLMNEPTWGFSALLPAKGLLACPGPGPAREAFAEFLEAGSPCGLDPEAVRRGEVLEVRDSEACGACRAFSEQLVTRFFGTLNAAARRASPGHLNLGIRYYTVPPDWCLAGMRGFDVFSINCYEKVPPADKISAIAAAVGAPVLIGEWHFGALDAGLPGSGIGHVRDQQQRGKAYRRYLEHAAAHPDLVGAHYFTLYDESALGRFDGENWNIGFLDVCNRPYSEMVEAARVSHGRLYPVAAGHAPPFDEMPEYLPLLFV